MSINLHVTFYPHVLDVLLKIVSKSLSACWYILYFIFIYIYSEISQMFGIPLSMSNHKGRDSIKLINFSPISYLSLFLKSAIGSCTCMYSQMRSFNDKFIKYKVVNWAFEKVKILSLLYFSCAQPNYKILL